MDQNVKGFQPVNIFVASSGELKEEREKFIEVVNSINKVIKPLHLEVVRWETDLESGSYKKKKIQEAIDPFLEKSQIVFVLVYSKIGEFTLEEYNVAIEKEKKVFLYFKQGFSPKNPEESKSHLEVLEFRDRIEKENRLLFRDYETIDQFKIFIREDLELYLKEEPPQPQPPSKKDDKIQKYLTSKPAKTIDLIGREEELKDIAHALERSDRVLLVNGLGGVGKTELCKRYFWDHIDHYIHLAWVDVVGNIRESFVSAFNIKGIGFKEGDSMDERFEKIMDFLNCLDKHSLLVVDNIENPEDEDLDRIRALPFKVIANSRLNFEGFETHTLDFLSPEKCRDLFYKHYRGKRDDTYADKIVERCGQHTLSVELMARTAQNAALPIKSLYEKLETRGFNLNDVIGDKVHTFWRNVKERKRFFNHTLKVFDLSNVTKEELHILTNLSVLPPIYIPIADFCEWMELKTKEDINSLVFKGWLKQEGFNIFMHQVIQEVIRYKTSPDAKKCKNVIQALSDKLGCEPGENPIEKKDYVIFAETLLQHIEKNDKELATLSNNLSLRLKDLGALDKAFEFQLKALKIREEVLDKNHPSLATSYNNLSTIYQALGQPEKALEFQLKALKIKEEVLDKNHPSLATSYNNLADIYRDFGQPEKALEFQLKALKIKEEVLDKNHPSLAISFNVLSLIYRDLGNLDKALEFQLKSLKIREEVLDKNHPYLATTYNNLSLIYQDLGQPEKALEFQFKALEIDKNILDKNHPYLATTYNNLAIVYMDLKDYKSAVQYGEKAVAILQKVFPDGHPDLDVMKENLEVILEYLKRERRKKET
jgi:tetratricopeptide (TPR) repeat protein